MLEDKTGVFALTDAQKEDRREEDALASIFAKRNNASVAVAEVQDIEKTAVLDRVAPLKTSDEPLPVDEEETEDNEPFYVENTAMERAVNKRKMAHLRERKIKQLKARQSKKTFAYVLGGISLVIFIITISAWLSYYIVRVSLDFTGITRNEFEIEIEIPPNSTTQEIAAILNQKGIITQPRFFVLYSQLSGHDGKYLDGLFRLESSMSYGTIVRTLQTSISARETAMVTIPEGFTAEEIGLLLEENHVCLASDFIKYYREKQNVFSFERRVSGSTNKFYQLEGYLFPDTYEFFVVDALRDGVDLNSLTEKEREAITNQARIAAFRMFDNFNSLITPELYKTMHEQGFTLDELMTLASMVQAEAAYIEDMRLVASVFINRMNSNDFTLLQSDPTTYYVRDFIRPNVPARDLNMYLDLMEAYDTYITAGLPPGPINNPGIDAIMSVLEAPQTSYYYFCANIETGEVFFARTLAEHEANLVRVGAEMTGVR